MRYVIGYVVLLVCFFVVVAPVGAQTPVTDEVTHDWLEDVHTRLGNVNTQTYWTRQNTDASMNTLATITAQQAEVIQLLATPPATATSVWSTSTYPLTSTVGTTQTFNVVVESRVTVGDLAVSGLVVLMLLVTVLSFFFSALRGYLLR